MALLFQEQKDGLQLGKHLDRCFLCEKEYRAKRETLVDGLLENKEIFLLNISGLRHCLCMDHFKSLLGDNTLISNEEYIQLQDLLNQVSNISQEETIETTEEVKEAIEETNEIIEDKKEKQSAKTTKTAKSSKGK